jgi:hypothetical protein
MFITQIEYSELFSDDFNNFKVGATSDVEQDENPSDVLEDLKRYVQGKLKEDHQEYNFLWGKISDAKLELARLQDKNNALMREHRDQVAAYRGTLERIFIYEDLSF